MNLRQYIRLSYRVERIEQRTEPLPDGCIPEDMDLEDFADFERDEMDAYWQGLTADERGEVNRWAAWMWTQVEDSA